VPDWAGSKSFLTLRSVFQKKWYDRKVRCHKGSVENPHVCCTTCMRTRIENSDRPACPRIRPVRPVPASVPSRIRPRLASYCTNMKRVEVCVIGPLLALNVA